MIYALDVALSGGGISYYIAEWSDLSNPLDIIELKIKVFIYRLL